MIESNGFITAEAGPSTWQQSDYRNDDTPKVNRYTPRMSSESEGDPEEILRGQEVRLMVETPGEIQEANIHLAGTTR